MVETPHAVVDARHARGPRALHVPRPRGGLPHAPEQHGPRQRDVRRRTDSVLRRRAAGGLRPCRSTASTASKFGARHLPDRLPVDGASTAGATTRASSATATCRRPIREIIDVAVLDMHHGWPNLGPRCDRARGAERGVRPAGPSRGGGPAASACSPTTFAAVRQIPGAPRRAPRDLPRHGRARAPRSDQERRRRARARRASARIRAGKRRSSASSIASARTRTRCCSPCATPSA